MFVADHALFGLVLSELRSRPRSDRAIQRVRVRAEGVVQGVGFRPFVHRLAGELGLAGFVRNDERGAVIEAEGDPAAIEACSTAW